MISDISNLQKILKGEIHKCSNVFIIGHNNPDFDSVAGALGVKHLVNYYGKKSYIVVNDEPSKIEPGAKKIIDENDDGTIIDRDEALKLIDNNSLLIVVDTNKKDMISLASDLNKFKNIIIIDHHDIGENTIDTKDIFISLDSSSVSEIMTRILNNLRIDYGSKLSNYLLAGISLDTKRFKIATTATTHDVAEKLIDRGADISYVNNLFLEEFESYCKISNLIINGTLIRKYSSSIFPVQVSFTLNRMDKEKIYLKEDFAKAADRMLKFNGIDASFVMGYVDKENIHISSRSNKKVNVGKIMEHLGGGGTVQTAGALIKNVDILDVEKRIMEYVPLGIESDLEPIKVKRLTKSNS